jgi:DNA-binding transcriptional regulator LsrR (DeoR family)
MQRGLPNVVITDASTAKALLQASPTAVKEQR